MKAAAITLICLFFCLLGRENAAHAETFLHKTRFVPTRNFEENKRHLLSRNDQPVKATVSAEDAEDISLAEDDEDEASRRAYFQTKGLMLYAYACLLARREHEQAGIPFDFHLAALSACKYLHQCAWRI